MSTTEDIYAGPDPDYDELVAAAEYLAAQVGLSIQSVDPDAMALLLVHRDAKPHTRAAFMSKGAVEIPNDGTMLEVIDGPQLTALGIPSSAGGIRVVIITRLSCRVMELPMGTDDSAAALGARLLGGGA